MKRERIIVFSKKILLIGLVLLIGLTPVLANDSDIVLFSDDITEIDDSEEIANEFDDNSDELVRLRTNNLELEGVEDDSSDIDETQEIANETVNNSVSNDEITNDSVSTNETANETDNYSKFEQHWYSFMSQTSYERYSNFRKSYSQMEDEKSFNCYDGAKYTIYLAKHYGLNAEIQHGFWDGVGHGTAIVYKEDGTSEMFDTTQYQKGFGRNGLEDSIYWDKIDHYSTDIALEKAEKELSTNPIEIVVNEINDVLFDNKEKEIDLSVDLSVDLSTDISFDILKLFN